MSFSEDNMHREFQRSSVMVDRNVFSIKKLGIRAYCTVNLKYFNPLAYDTIIKIVSF